MAEFTAELEEIEAVLWSMLAPVAVTPGMVPVSTSPPADEYVVVSAKVPVAWVEGGFVIPLTVRVNVWAGMSEADELRLVKVMELSSEL